MVASMLAGFEEFQNTKASKKAINNQQNDKLVINVRTIKGWKGKKAITFIFTKDLIAHLKKKKMTTFKLLYNEKENAIGLRYDNSSNCINIEERKIQPNGTLPFQNEFITYTFLPIMEKENLKSIKFVGNYFEMGSCYIFRPTKKSKSLY